MTRQTFGADLAGEHQQPRPPHPRDGLELDAVAEALAGDYEAAALADLAAIVTAADSADDPGSPAGRLLAQLAAAYQDATLPPRPPEPSPFPPGRPVAFSLHASDAPDAEPLEVVFDDGERGTVVPAGRTDWRLADGLPPGGEVVAEVVDHADARRSTAELCAALIEQGVVATAAPWWTPEERAAITPTDPR